MIDPNLPHHRKVLRLAKALRVGQPAALGYLVNLWCAAMRSSEGGVLVGWLPDEIRQAAGWGSDPDRFLTAMEAAGFLEKDGDTYTIHEWIEHQGDIIATRAADRERKRRVRAESEGSPAESDPPSPPLPIPSLPSPTTHSLSDVSSPAGRAWNVWSNGKGYPINRTTGIRLIECAVARGAEHPAIEVAFWDEKRCAGKKIWEVLDDLAPAEAGKTDMMSEILKKWVAGGTDAPK